MTSKPSEARSCAIAGKLVDAIGTTAPVLARVGSALVDIGTVCSIPIIPLGAGAGEGSDGVFTSGDGVAIVSPVVALVDIVTSRSFEVAISGKPLRGALAGVARNRVGTNGVGVTIVSPSVALVDIGTICSSGSSICVFIPRWAGAGVGSGRRVAVAVGDGVTIVSLGGAFVDIFLTS